MAAEHLATLPQYLTHHYCKLLIPLAAKKLVVDVPPEKPHEDPLKSPFGRAVNPNRSLSPIGTSPNNASEPQSRLWDTRDGSPGVPGNSQKDRTKQEKGHQVVRSAGSESNITLSGMQDLRRQHSGGLPVNRQSSKLLVSELQLPGQDLPAASGDAANTVRPCLAKSAVTGAQYRNSSSRDSDADSTVSSETSEADSVNSRPTRFSDSQAQPRVSFTESGPALKHSSSLQSAQARQTGPVPVPLGPPPIVSRSRSSVELMRLRHLLENSNDSYSTAARAKIRAGNMQQQWQEASIAEGTGDSSSSDDWRPIRRTASANAADTVGSAAHSLTRSAAVRRSNSPLDLLVNVSDSILGSGTSNAPVSVTSSGPQTLLWPTHSPTAGGSGQKGQQLPHAAAASSNGNKGTMSSASAIAVAASQAITTMPAASQPNTAAGRLTAVVQRVFSGNRSHINKPNSHQTGYKNQSLGFRPHDAPVDLMNERAEMAESEMDSTRYDTIMEGLVRKQPQSKQPGVQPHRQGGH